MLETDQTPYKQLQAQQIKYEDEEQYVGDWEMIPAKAFLFFPTGQEIKSGNKQKQWRKIFDINGPYEEFEQQNLIVLEKRLKQYKIQTHPWFNKANKLRVLQAQKFKITDTCNSLKQGSKWRKNDFPIKMDHKLESLLKSGAAYFCGRDRHYRPILVVDIGKFKSSDEQFVSSMLSVLLEYMIGELLIEGQVQNYNLVMNLSQFSMGMKSTVSKILSFTSNTYRGRMFACYILGIPGLLRFGWDTFATKFVSENTLKKIKIKSELQNRDMWTHIDRQRIQRKYGGTMEDVTSENFWPPSKDLLNWKIQQTASKTQLPGHISQAQYEQKYMKGELIGRKVYVNYIHHIRDHRNKKQIQSQKNQKLAEDINTQQFILDNKNDKTPKKPGKQEQAENLNQLSTLPITQKDLKQSTIKKLQQFTKTSVRKQKVIKMQTRNFKLMFQSDEFFAISGLI